MVLEIIKSGKYLIVDNGKNLHSIPTMFVHIVTNENGKGVFISNNIDQSSSYRIDFDQYDQILINNVPFTGDAKEMHDMILDMMNSSGGGSGDYVTNGQLEAITDTATVVTMSEATEDYTNS